MSLKSELTKIVDLLEKDYGGVKSLDREDPLDQLIVLILAAGSTQKKADDALGGLRSSFVDWNEVRVTALHDIDRAIASALGAKSLDGKAQLIRDVLGAIYARFNKVDLGFCLEKGDKQNARRRERLFNYLAERSPALPPLMTCYFDGRRADVQVSGSLGRMLGRLGIFKKGTSPAKMRKEIEAALDEGQRLVFLGGAWQIAEGLCHRNQPDCGACPLKKNCKTAPAEMERARKAEEAERAKARREARKLAEKIAREARAAARRAEAERKAAEKKEAARKAAEKKKAEAERKKTEAKKAAEKKKVAAQKAAEKKKAAAQKAAEKKKAAAQKKTEARKKAAAKKAATKKKTTAGQKTGARKTATRKTGARKTAGRKKTAARKTTTKKSSARKTGARATAGRKKTTGKKKTTAGKKKTNAGRKTGARKTTGKKKTGSRR